jgi:hypothetical protein
MKGGRALTRIAGVTLHPISAPGFGVGINRDYAKRHAA